MAVFGFASCTRSARVKACQGDLWPVSVAILTSTGSAAPRHILMPIQTRYAPPARRSVRLSHSTCVKSAVSPATAMEAKMNPPTPIPAAAASPSVRPPDTAMRETTRKLGPGLIAPRRKTPRMERMVAISDKVRLHSYGVNTSECIRPDAVPTDKPGSRYVSFGRPGRGTLSGRHDMRTDSGARRLWHVELLKCLGPANGILSAGDCRIPATLRIRSKRSAMQP